MKIEGTRPGMFPECATCPIAKEAFNSIRDPQLDGGGTIKEFQLTNRETKDTIIIPFTDTEIRYAIDCVFVKNLFTFFRERLILHIEVRMDSKNKNSKFPSPLATIEAEDDVTNDCPGLKR